MDIKSSKPFVCTKSYLYAHIYLIYMTRLKLTMQSELRIKNIFFIKKRVTPFGTGAKVDCPKEYLGKTVYLVITDE